MKRIAVFAGTSEGRILAEHLAKQNREVYISVATDYGAKILPQEGLHIQCGRMDRQKMHLWLGEIRPDVVVDATHPFAVEVSENIRQVCDELGMPMHRLLRDLSEQTDETNCFEVDSVTEAAQLAQQLCGNIFLTIGSKQLREFTGQISDFSRIYARVLSTRESVEICEQIGLQGKQLICMQGPFSEELNLAMYQSTDARILVTKESGSRGGFSEKVAAAAKLGMKVIIIRRPDETGASLQSLCHKLGVPEMDAGASSDSRTRTVYLIGIGMGSQLKMTIEAHRALEQAQVIIGAGRMRKVVAGFSAPFIEEYRADHILDYLEENRSPRKIAVALSGDVGFYSAAASLQEKLEAAGYEVVRICGISSVVEFAAKVNLPWQELHLVSNHGRECHLLAQIKTHFRTFALLSDGTELPDIYQELLDRRMDVKIYLGFDLGYESQQIVIGTVSELAGQKLPKHDLCVAIFENPDYDRTVTGNLSDASFARAERVPMTKEEVRSIVLSKLRLQTDAIVYDIGAGTGAVTMDLAKYVTTGKIYAIEKKPEALEVLRQNARTHAGEQVRIVEGTAPEALEDLESPTHAFIGGSSGHLKEIVQLLLEKNPGIRIVADAITLETVAECNALLKELPVRDIDICSLQVSKAKAVGDYALMTAQNPIYIFTFTGAGHEISETGDRGTKKR